MERTILQYQQEIDRLDKERREILTRAKTEAKEIITEANRRVELTIKEIREAQAEKEETRRIREELRNFEQDVDEIDLKQKDDAIQKKIEQIQQRQQRREERKRNKQEGKLTMAEQKAAEVLRDAAKRVNTDKPIAVGDTVRIRGTKTVGMVNEVTGKVATVFFNGGIRSKVRVDRLEHAMPEVPKVQEQPSQVVNDNELRGGLSAIAAALLSEQKRISRMTRDTMDSRQRNFHQDLDIRGMRGDEALSAVQYFIDDAILVGVQQVRILHGKGNGILRQLVRQYLGTVPNVIRYHDEDIRFGGTGITVAEF